MSKRLLIVEDEINLLQAIAINLRLEGFEVQTARDGADALSQIIANTPDLIISDIRMPRIDGFKLARKLRSTPHTSMIPIIFLTGCNETEDRIKSYRAGVDAILTKPFEPDELLALILNILDRTERMRTEIKQLFGQTETEKNNDSYDEELTEVENRIAGAVARALTNKEIAAEFNLSVRTVENHISRILAKKNFHNRVEIARLVLEHSQSRQTPFA